MCSLQLQPMTLSKMSDEINDWTD
uniref:Uncharacterized protein n=1 Tax=Anguilla anguilla TaxID=7936 RepID=A0A0E9TB73_ANGAN